jgi:acyl carrier protein
VIVHGLRVLGGRLLTVLDRTNSDLSEHITRIVRRIMDKRALADAVGPDDDLRDRGLSSLDIVNLMLTVETEFGIKIPERDMTPSNFRSVARIAELVRGLA